MLHKRDTSWSIVTERARGTIFMCSRPNAEEIARRKWGELVAETNAAGIVGSAWLFNGREVVETIGRPFRVGDDATALAV
jgi:hypothetical protein